MVEPVDLLTFTAAFRVLRVVKTRQATYSILKHLSEYVHSLEKVGILEQKEMFHLHDSVQTDLKRLLRNPPLVKMPKVRDILSAHPLLGALPSVVRKPLENSTKQTMKLRGVTLYREGTKPTGIWLISNGVVKWSSKNLRNRHSLHPTFSHGSTLGLYEVLIGKPYICDIVTDSVVHCFFIETEKILQVLGSDLSVEEFLWQECAIVIAKLLLPQNFEIIAMQELRVLVTERSTMKIYIRGEIIEIRPHTIGFVLEGFVKTQDAQDNLITSPAALLPSYADLNLHNFEVSGGRMGSSSHQGAYYHVETRARVIIFDMVPFDASGHLQRESSSFVDLPKSQTKEHRSLMSWPEHFYKHHLHTGGNDDQAKSLTERAMGLGIFGSMISLRRRRYQSFPRSSNAKPSHNLSWIESSARPLISVKSEGAAATIGEKLRPRESVGSKPSPLPVSSRNKASAGDDSSYESGPEDEHIVRIDSPSRLSFRQSSGPFLHPHPGGS
ncbi:Son of sevenless 1 [Asimina triloba]